MNYKSVSKALCLAVTALLAVPGVATAGSWSLSGVPSTCPAGGGACAPVVAVQFAGDGSTFDAQTSISIPAGFTAAPVGANGGGCNVVGSNINITSSTAVLIPAGPTTFCNVTYTVNMGTAVGPYNITPNGGIATGCFDSGGNTVNPCTAHANGTGALVVSAGPPVAPTISYAPNPVNFPAGTAIGQNQDVNVTPTASGGANGGVTTVNCTTSSPGFSIPTAATTCTDNTCVPTPLVFRCTSSTATQNGTATCTATPTNPAGAAVPTTINMTCPAANVTPTITSTVPAYGTADATPEITFPVVGIGMPANQTVTVNATGGSGTGVATYTCSTASAGFTVTDTTATFNGTATTDTVAVRCDAAAVAQQTGTMTCVEIDSDSPGPGGTSRNYDLLCPAGTPESAPGVTYGPVAGSTLTFAQGAAIGSPTTQNVTVDINGGIDGGDANPESLSVTCATASAGFSVTNGGPYSANSPAAMGTDGTVTVTCSAGAAQQLGTMTCTETPRIDGVAGMPTSSNFPLDCPAAAVNIASAPAEGNIDLFGVPAATLNGTITLTNTGSQSTLSCIATAGTANVALGVVPATVPAGGQAAIPFTCTAGGPGATLTGSIQCTTQDPDAEGTLDYTVNCTGLSSNPIPAINDLGKLLMVALVIGLGLLGLGARRQMV